MGGAGGGEAAAFDALADGYRREILAMLRQGDLAVHEIALKLPISRPAVSRHLRLLKEAGFVEEEVVGTRHLYHLRDEGVKLSVATSKRSGARPRRGSASSRRTSMRAPVSEPLELEFEVACRPSTAFRDVDTGARRCGGLAITR